jgi:hypothetical protein
MSGLNQLFQHLLGRRGADAGCDDSLEVLDLFVEEELEGRRAADTFPAVAVHLESCPDCREDYEGLRELARSNGSAPRGISR